MFFTGNVPSVFVCVVLVTLSYVTTSQLCFPQRWQYPKSLLGRFWLEDLVPH